ncbi:unnamed protein product [Nesidiocoris tenuis]|uniref:Uncharacterized protein n=1 Tax=Nesidiocoris tenuis TaxID=355587 RepID=A0A6H5HRL8_9HEMI|nr:unnamed protein product [Nesidiocoris tenuis]
MEGNPNFYSMKTSSNAIKPKQAKMAQNTSRPTPRTPTPFDPTCDRRATLHLVCSRRRSCGPSLRGAYANWRPQLRLSARQHRLDTKNKLRSAQWDRATVRLKGLVHISCYALPLGLTDSEDNVEPSRGLYSPQAVHQVSAFPYSLPIL